LDSVDEPEDAPEPEPPALLAGVSSFMHFSSSAPVIPAHFAAVLLPMPEALPGALPAGAAVLPPDALSLLELPDVAPPDVLGLAALAPPLVLPVVLPLVLSLLPLLLDCAHAADAMPMKAAVTAALISVRFMKDSSRVGLGTAGRATQEQCPSRA
jgi:hypothetical protein